MTARSGTLGERIITPETAWDRVVRWGLFCFSLAAILGLIFAGVRFLVWPLRVLFAPIALAAVVTYLLNPIVSALQRRGLRRGAAVALVSVAFASVVGLALAYIVPVIARQISGFIGDLPRYVDDASAATNRFLAARHLRFRINLTADQVQQYVVSNKDAIIGILGGVRSFAFGVLHVLITIVIGAILSVYILLDLPKIRHTLGTLVPDHRRGDLLSVAERIGGVLGGFFRGQLLVATFVGLASALGLTLVKIPFAAVVGLIAGVFNLVPLIGPFIGAVPAVFLGLLSGDPIRALWAMLVLLAVQQVDNHIISPNVMGRTVRLHPITVMLTLLAAGSIFGIFGMLIAIPVVAGAKEIVKFVWERRAVREAVASVVPEGVGPPLEQPKTSRRVAPRAKASGGKSTRTRAGSRTK